MEGIWKILRILQSVMFKVIFEYLFVFIFLLFSLLDNEILNSIQFFPILHLKIGAHTFLERDESKNYPFT